MNKIAIIGGGASGFFAAIIAKKRNPDIDITIFEAEKLPLKKLSVTGNGKCNITNDDMEYLRERYYTGDYLFLSNVISGCDVKMTIDAFEALGIRIIKKRDGYYYPKCDSAKAFAQSLINIANGLRIKIKANCPITDIRRTDRGLLLYNNSYEMCFDRVLIASGSTAGFKTSSNGYSLAKSAGHSIIPVRPALTSLKYADKRLDILAKQRINAKVSLITDNKISAVQYGEVQFNMGNVSGIPVMQISHMAVDAVDKGKNPVLLLDLEMDTFLSELIRSYEKEKNELYFLSLKQFLDAKYPIKYGEFLAEFLGLNRDMPLSDISYDELHKIAALVKNLEIVIDSYGDLASAQVASGGVNLSEIDSNTMQSRLCPNLFFAGEVLDVDGFCGGYNLQFAWSSAYLAAVSMIR